MTSPLFARTRVVAIAFALVAVISGGPGGAALAWAQAAPSTAATPKPRPKAKGRLYKLRVDSSPQQAAIYWDAGATPAPRDYGIAGYTPMDLRVPKGNVKIILELKGFKTAERDLQVTKNQTVTVTLERAPQPARLDLRASGDAAGGEILIDGVPRGTIPNVFELFAGRHQIEVRKPGYKPWSEWVDLAEDERRTRDVVLEKLEAPAGSLLVTSDAGGDVYVDGTRRDVAPTVVSGLAPGDHVVEVRKEGVPPWRQTVTISSGRQTKVSATLAPPPAPAAPTPQAPPPAATASIRVIANEPDVTVFVDGEPKGKAPVDVANLRPGDHIIEGRKPGFKTEEQAIKLPPGEQALLRITMQRAPEDRPKAHLRVQSQVPDAEVFIDGSSAGKAPVDRSDLEPGKHFIVVSKPGYAEFKREVVLVPGQPVSLVADLSATGTLKFLSSPAGAEVTIDGEPVGATPVTRTGVSAGEHIVEFRLKGHFDARQNIKLEGGKERIVQQDLRVIPTGPTPEQVMHRKMGMSSWGARVNPVYGFTADVGAGYPYIFMGRLTVGAWSGPKRMGLDAGVEFRTYFDTYDLGLHARFQFLEVGPLALAARAMAGGGMGPNGRGTYFFDATVLGSLTFSDIVTFTTNLTLSTWSDRFCPTQAELERGTTAEGFCTAATRPTDPNAPYDPWPTFNGKDPNANRFGGARLYLGFALTVAIDRQISVFLALQFLPMPNTFGYEERLAFVDRVNSVMATDDTFFYGTGGVSFKF